MSRPPSSVLRTGSNIQSSLSVSFVSGSFALIMDEALELDIVDTNTNEQAFPQAAGSAEPLSSTSTSSSPTPSLRLPEDHQHTSTRSSTWSSVCEVLAKGIPFLAVSVSTADDGSKTATANMKLTTLALCLLAFHLLLVVEGLFGFAASIVQIAQAVRPTQPIAQSINTEDIRTYIIAALQAFNACFRSEVCRNYTLGEYSCTYVNSR